MRTTLNISDELLGEVMKLSGVSSKTRVIEMALKEYMRKLKREEIKGAYGNLDLDVDIMMVRAGEKDE